MTAPQLISNATNNITGIYSVFQYVVEVNSWFFVGILFAMLIILFVILRSVSSKNSLAFGGSTFFTMILSILFRTLGFIGNKWMYASITSVAIAIVWMHLENAKE